MSLGLGALRLVPPPQPAGSAQTYNVDDPTNPDPAAASGDNVVSIELEDGSVSINLGPNPQRPATEAEHSSNLAEFLAPETLAELSTQLLMSIEDDDRSRDDWLSNRAKGIEMLGFRLEDPATGSSAPLDGMSRVRHPMLAEAVIRFQATSRGELLPADGPVKIRDDNPGGIRSMPAEALALQTDMNRYITYSLPEYYPDTDRMLFWVGLGGSGFKKVYHCPIRRRPVSDAVDAKDLIVNAKAVDLTSANRKTHRIKMKPSTLRRMQIVGAYRDIYVPPPYTTELDAVDEESSAVSGMSVTYSLNEKDNEHTIYECYCELDIPGFEHTNPDGERPGLLCRTKS